MGYLSPWKLGVLGYEKDLAFIKPTFAISTKEVAAEGKNLNGDYRKSLIKENVPIFSMTGTRLSIDDYNLFSGLKSIQAILNFKYRDDLKQLNQINTSRLGYDATIINTSATGITILGVWLATDPAHVGDNYYTGGSFDESTGLITFGTNLPDPGLDILIDYSYTGNAVHITTLDLQALSGASRDFYTATLTLEGA